MSTCLKALFYGVCLSCLSSLCLAHSVPHGAYFSLGLGYSHVLDSGNNSQVDIVRSGLSNQTLTADSDRPEANLQGLVEGGYRWLLSDHISFGLGLALSHTSYDVSGSSTIKPANISIDYNYTIQASMIEPTLRLAYSQAHWSYFIAGTMGASFLRSKSYSTQGNQRDDYDANTTTRLLKGVELGVTRYLNDQTGVSLGIGYSDLGQAELGDRDAAAGTDNNGTIEQQIDPVSVQLAITHWFG